MTIKQNEGFASFSPAPTMGLVVGWHLDKGKVAGGTELKLIVKKITKLASN